MFQRLSIEEQRVKRSLHPPKSFFQEKGDLTFLVLPDSLFDDDSKYAIFYFIGISMTSNSDFTSAWIWYSSTPQSPTASLRSKVVPSVEIFPWMRNT